MKEFTAEQKQSESMSALYWIMQQRESKSYPVYIGLDVHKDTIVVAVARLGRGPSELWGEIVNTPKAVAQLVARLSRELGGEVLSFCYEAA